MSSPVHAASGAKSPKKQEYFAKLQDLVNTHSQIIIVEADNVGSRQMSEIRLALRGRATILMGKNTMIKTCLRQIVDSRPELESLIELVKDNIGLIFCKDEPAAIRKTISQFKVPCYAKMGAVAPCDVFVQPGLTGMDPAQTSFFQSLGIATKIGKGQIEILNEEHIVKVGERVTASQAALLAKLNIMPFSYGLKCATVWDNGSHYPATVLDISAEDIEASIKSAVSAVAALSLGAEFPTACSAPHIILNAFRKVAALAIATDFDFPEIASLKEAIANPQAFAAAAPAAAGAAAPVAAAAAAPEPESEEEDMDFSLFD